MNGITSKYTWYKWIGIILLLIGSFFLIVVIYGAFSTWNLPIVSAAFTICVLPFLLPGIFLTYYGIKYLNEEAELVNLANLLKMYGKISIDDVATNIGKTPEDAEISIKKCIEMNLVDGYLDYDTREFITRTYRESMYQPQIIQQPIQPTYLPPPPPPEFQQNQILVLTAFTYQGSKIIYKVKIENKSSYPIASIKVKPYIQEDTFIIDKEQIVLSNVIEPNNSQTATFTLRPRGECGKRNIGGDVEYYDMQNRKKRETEIPMKEIEITCPLLKTIPINEIKWKEITPNLINVEEEFTDIPIPSEQFFEVAKEIIQERNFYLIPPNKSKVEGFFRGIARFYAEGVRGFRYAVQIEVFGGKTSKLILKAFAENEGALTGCYYGILDDIEKRIKIKERLVEHIIVQGDYIQSKTEVKDSVVVRSQIGKESMEDNIAIQKSQKTTAENMKIYKKALKKAYEDGIITDDEKAMLIALRESLGITDDMHRKLENEVKNEIEKEWRKC